MVVSVHFTPALVVFLGGPGLKGESLHLKIVGDISNKLLG